MRHGRKPRQSIACCTVPRVRKAYGPIRVRLISLILLAAVPLLLLAGTIAWQNYTLALGVSGDAVIRLRESAMARHAAAVESAQQLMQALSELPELFSADPQRCHDRLAGILDLWQQRYSNVAFFTADGKLHCAGRKLIGPNADARAEAMNKPLFIDAATGSGLALGPVRISTLVNGPVIPAAFAVRHSGAIVGFLYTGLRMDWFTAMPGSILPILPVLWLVDRNGLVTSLAAAHDGALPNALAMRALLVRARGNRCAVQRWAALRLRVERPGWRLPAADRLSGQRGCGDRAQRFDQPRASIGAVYPYWVWARWPSVQMARWLRR